MYKLSIRNAEGETITLTQNESFYQVLSIDGLNPPSAVINRSLYAGLDGAKFNSSKLNERNVVITLKLNGNPETARIELYRFFRTKDFIRVFYENGTRNVYVDGYVETIECGLFTNDERMQISIICPNPYFHDFFEDIEETSKSAALFEFPFYINENNPIEFSTYSFNTVCNVFNGSESESGMIIQADFTSAVSDLIIRNTITAEQMEIVYGFVSGDRLTINTNRGSKSITLLREASEQNVFAAMTVTSTFLQLSPGDNVFAYLADNGQSDTNVHITYKHRQIYRGV